VRDTRNPSVCARLGPMLALPFRERADDFPCARPAGPRPASP
jgi:hypothetical protein